MCSSHVSYFSTPELVEELVLFVLALPLLRRGGLLDHVRCERRDPCARVLLRVQLDDLRGLQALDHERVRVVQDLIEGGWIDKITLSTHSTIFTTLIR